MPNFFNMEVDEVIAALNSNRETGLSSEEVLKRQAQYGKNSLPREGGTTLLRLLISQFTDLMVIILIVAAFISAFLGEYSDVVVIMIIVVLNAALGVYQEYQAEQALAALSAMQVPLVRVRRDNGVHQISAEDIVPGDIVLLEEGDRVPADGRLIGAINLHIEEAALTGESVPVDKGHYPLKGEKVALGDQNNMAFMSTAVTYGRGILLVTQIGLNTELGKIASMLMGVEEGITPLQRRLNQLGKILAAAALIVVVIVFLVGYFIQGIPFQQMFLIAVSLAVAAVPEGLPALVTIGLSLGAARMVRRHALIRRLPAVETLGSVTVICSDKTGTLTKNEMTATYLALPGHDNVVVEGIGYTPRGGFQSENGQPLDPRENDNVGRFIKAMALSTNAHLEEIGDSNTMNVVGDTTEGALIVAAQKVGWTRDLLEVDLPRVGELPFSSERKAMTTVHELLGSEARKLYGGPGAISITKGAPDRLMSWASYEHIPEGPRPLSEERRQAWQDIIDRMASQGLRVLGIGYRHFAETPQGPYDESIERDLIMLGLVGILDPARPEAKAAVKVAREAGIRVIMITGDHALTAEAIARDLGILGEDERAVTGNQLDQMNEKEIEAALDRTSCFARVSPSHKLQLVKLLQKKGHVAAMTGDGVNDAPALKQADIGVAMGITGTDVSKGAADMVLTDDNFASIVAAVEEGRTVYDNIRKFIKYLLSSNVGEILVVFAALLAGMKVPLLAIQILWVNLVTDGLPAIALGFEKAEEGVMHRKPRPVSESIFAQGTGQHIIWVGVLIAVLTLGCYIWGYTSQGMDAFSPTLGLEEFSYDEIIEVVGAERVPEGWDSFSVSKREALLLEDYERLTAEEIRVITDGHVVVPENWDTLSEAERQQALGEEAMAVMEEETSGGLLGIAESVPRTLAFTLLAFTQMFEVMAIHAGDRTAFSRRSIFGNKLLLGAVIATFALQLAMIYVPFLQGAFKTAPLSLEQIIVSFALASLVLFGVEIEKIVRQRWFSTEVVATPA